MKTETLRKIYQKQYRVTLTGETALLMHADNIAWADKMKEWSKDGANKKASVAGDDRTPAFRWLGCLYHDGTHITIPSDNLMTVLREGGSKCPTGKGTGTFKRQTQSGIVVDQCDWPLLVRGKLVPIKELMALEDLQGDQVELFKINEQTSQKYGFELFVKRAGVSGKKHVRVRPRFNQWSCTGTVTVFDQTITTSVLNDVLTFAGAFAGLGDWRPSSPMKPGPYGKFTAALEEI